MSFWPRELTILGVEFNLCDLFKRKQDANQKRHHDEAEDRYTRKKVDERQQQIRDEAKRISDSAEKITHIVEELRRAEK